MKKQILIGIMLLLLTVGVVSANDALTDGEYAFDNNQIELNTNPDDSLQKHESFLNTANEANFKNLGELINNTEENSEIKLTNDYAYNKDTDSEFKNGINIEKAITLDGQGHEITGSDNQLFAIKENNVTLKNLILKFTHINSYGNCLNIINCSFIDCISENGGAIYSNGNNTYIANCSFIDCVSEDGGAIYSNGNNTYIANCSFRDCIAYGVSINNNGHFGEGGGICFKGDAINLINCSFIDCNAENGGAIHSNGNNINITNCSFMDCSAFGELWRYDSSTYRGGAIFSEGNNTNVANCRFKDVVAGAGGGIYSWSSDCNIINCSFLNCTVSGSYPYDGPTGNGGAIYSGNTNCNIACSSFIKCSADYGGAIYTSSWNIKCNIVNCRFTDCSAQYKNEPVYFKGTKVQYKIAASNLNIFYNDESYFKVKIYLEDNNIASGLSVAFKLNGKTFKTKQTDANGYAKVKITYPPGTYSISAKVGTKTITKKLTVNQVLSIKKINAKKSAEKLVLTATLKKENTPLKDKQITFKFNGKTYKAKTNSKGIAKVTIPKSVLKNLKIGKKITYQATYIKDTVKKTAKVQK